MSNPRFAPRRTVFPSLPGAALAVVGVATVLRLVAATELPLNSDETYYWSWSRHLAFGYVDHPPVVAWLIALSSPLGRAPGIVRLPFVFCEALTALALGWAAVELSESATAGGVAAVAFTLLPQTKLAIGEARPDGPYMLGWALALWLTCRLATRPAGAGTGIALGVALGAAVLSRFFGWALVFGLAFYALTPTGRILWKRGLWLAFAIALAVYVPFLLWNAHHRWENIAFTVQDRQVFGALSLGRLFAPSSARFFVLALPFWIVAYFTALRPQYRLVAWTALPFPLFIGFLAPFERVESYWLLGPFESLCVGIGLSLATWPAPRLRALGAASALPALATTAVVLFLCLPERTQAAALSRLGGARSLLTSGVFRFEPLSTQVDSLASAHRATILTDAFEIGAPLYYHGVPSLLIGPAMQTPMWDAWPDIRPLGYPVPPRALVVRLNDLRAGDPVSIDLRRAYGQVWRGPRLRYAFAGVPEQTYYTFWCERPRYDAALLLYGAAPG